MEWPKEIGEQAKMLLDDSALPEEQYGAVMKEWSEGVYEKSIDGATRALVDLQDLISKRVYAERGLKPPNYRAKALLLASMQSKEI